MIRVLIADDFAILREDLKEQLELDPEIQVVGMAGTEEEIVAMALEEDADIILMDIEMDGANAGIRATERIRAVKPGQKILYLTVHETEEIVLAAMGTGAVDYMVKGQDRAYILEHIKKAHAGQPMMDAKIQSVLMREYKRLQRSERSLLFFINSVSQLTTAERELVRLLLEDKKVREIAQLRSVEIVTVKTQIKSLLKKFGCHRSKEIVSIIRELNICHLFS